MMFKYVDPNLEDDLFTCPHCHNLCNQQADMRMVSKGEVYDLFLDSLRPGRAVHIRECTTCRRVTVWVDNELVYPLTKRGPEPNPDMPAEVAGLYEEAREVYSRSPRAAAVLLRAAAEELCDVIDAKGNRLFDKIGSLVKKDILKPVQEALDSVRIVGGDAAHEGRVMLEGTEEDVETLFALMNYVVDHSISMPRKTGTFLEKVASEEQKKQIAERDGDAGN